MANLYGMRILVFILIVSQSIYAQTETVTYAERLGWPTGSKVVIFHVDDAGMSHESNLGAIRAIEKGVATSTSIMMPCPWVPEMADYCRSHPEIDAGLHLTLTSEWKRYRWGPVAGKPAVPGLVDSQGCLWPKVPDILLRATPDEVEIEIRAQIDRALAMGIRPTHLDAHMGTCFFPPLLARYVKVGIETDIPILIFGGHMQHIGPEIGPLKLLAVMTAKQVWDAGLPAIDDLVTKPTRAQDYEKRKAELFRLLQEMQPGITEIIVHCTVQTKHFRSISGSGPTREAELKLMTDPEVRAFIETEGILLTTWRELKERRKQVKK